MGVPIRFPIQTARLTIRPMRLDDAEALLAVYGDVETMQHLNQELASQRRRSPRMGPDQDRSF